MPKSINSLFLCGSCLEPVFTPAMYLKDTNKTYIQESNYTNVSCPNCQHVYAVKVILEDRQANLEK